MKKIVTLLLMMSFLLSGCSSAKQVKDIKILTPNGATALSLVSVYEEVTKAGEIKIVEGADLLSSEFVKKESDYDVIIAPINLGCQLMSKNQTDYRLAGVLTWGNLYIVENTNVKNNTLAAFGEMAVPGKIFNLVKDSNDILKNAKVTFYNAVSDVQAQMLAGKCQYALMAEPAATATIAKAKQNGSALKINVSLQDLYKQKMNANETGYPQAAIFVKDKKDVQELLSQLDKFTNQEAVKDQNQIESLVDQIGAHVFGVPNAKIAAQTWNHQNIHYKDANDVKDDITSLLKQFKIDFNDDMIIQ